MVDITQHYITMGNPENLGKSESPDSEPHTTDLSTNISRSFKKYIDTSFNYNVLMSGHC